MDAFSQLRHEHYLNHGTLDGSYAELFRALLGPDSGDVVTDATPELLPLLREQGAPNDALGLGVRPQGRSGQSQRRGMQLFQTMFYGDPMFSGLGSGGGLGTLVREVGNALAAGPYDIEVTTLVGRDTNGEHRTVQAREQAGPGHVIWRLNYAGNGQNDAFRSDEATLRAMLSEALKAERETSPLAAVVHTRYIDGASYAAAAAAMRTDCALVATITPDPHRTLCGPDGEFIPRTPADAATLVYRIKIGDALVRRADAMVGIGRSAVEQQLLPYFPQLENVGGRRVVGIDEGVQFIDKLPSDIDPWGIIDAALEGTPSGRGEVSGKRRGLPVLLCVGRLHPAKAQPELLQAWLESGLYHRYNLVLVGGDLRTPNPTETSMLEELERILAAAPPEARAGFLQVGALANNEVRLLEAAFALQSTPECQHVYVCPSPKEEFGLSILEAMAAGLPVCAPLRGGAPSYIRHGSNGLLMDTSSITALTAELGALLHPDSPVGTKLHHMAEAGRETVRKRYSLEGPAAELAAVYEAALAHSTLAHKHLSRTRQTHTGSTAL
ncbi:MAG: glycosyltransferase [Spirochaetaceae bacterium]|nr:MAG: glycosyltransferase [Spirochaetaceae bacterium]